MKVPYNKKGGAIRLTKEQPERRAAMRLRKQISATLRKAMMKVNHVSPGTTVRVKSDATMWGDPLAGASTYQNMVGQVTADKPVTGYEVVVEFGRPRGHASFYWRELEVVND